MVQKKFTSLDLYSSEYCEFIEYDFLGDINNENSNDNYSIKGSGTSIVGSFFLKDSIVLETHSESEVISLDLINKEIVVRPTITLSKLYSLLAPHHLFLSSVPSYPMASVGGCIAANVHGQNHVKEGCFANNIKSLVIYHPEKGLLSCSVDNNSNLFNLTLGGYGSTGIIHEVRLNLIEITTNILNVETITFSTLLEGFQLMERESKYCDYLHSWCDMSLANSKKQIGLISLGKFASGNKVEKYQINNKIKRIHMPILINIFGTNLMTIVNKMYYLINTIKRHKRVLLHNFIFPSRSNLFYFSMFGKKGVIEHQVLIPKRIAKKYLEDLMKIIARTKPNIPLCHLKVFGGNGIYLRFDGSGYCLALHLYNNSNGIRALEEIDKINIDYECKVNLIKDSRINAESINAQYKEIEKFRSKIREYDPSVQFRNNIIEKVFNKNE